MPENEDAQKEIFVSNHVSDMWDTIEVNGFEIAEGVNVAQTVNQLIEELRRIAYNEWLACKAKEACIRLLTGITTYDHGCGPEPA
jgi:hypothetical protein